MRGFLLLDLLEAEAHFFGISASPGCTFDYGNETLMSCAHRAQYQDARKDAEFGDALLPREVPHNTLFVAHNGRPSNQRASMPLALYNAAAAGALS
jgi:hypothetical protein